MLKLRQKNSNSLPCDHVLRKGRAKLGSLVAETLLKTQILLPEREKIFLNPVKNIFASRTQILLAKQMFSSLATRAAIPGKQCSLVKRSSITGGACVTYSLPEFLKKFANFFEGVCGE